VEWFSAELLLDAITQTIEKLAPLFAVPKRRLNLASTGTSGSAHEKQSIRDEPRGRWSRL
jgi:hypothetical protein